MKTQIIIFITTLFISFSAQAQSSEHYALFPVDINGHCSQTQSHSLQIADRSQGIRAAELSDARTEASQAIDYFLSWGPAKGDLNGYECASHFNEAPHSVTLREVFKGVAALSTAEDFELFSCIYRTQDSTSEDFESYHFVKSSSETYCAIVQ